MRSARTAVAVALGLGREIMESGVTAAVSNGSGVGVSTSPGEAPPGGAAKVGSDVEVGVADGSGVGVAVAGASCPAKPPGGTLAVVAVGVKVADPSWLMPNPTSGGIEVG